MPVKHGDPVGLERVPHVDGVVIVARKEDATRRREVHVVDAEQDGLFGVSSHLPEKVTHFRGG